MRAWFVLASLAGARAVERTRARGEQTRRELQALHHELDLLALDEGRADPPRSDPLDVSAEERDLEMTITLRKEWGLRLKMVEDEFDYECDLEGLPQFTGKMVSGFRRREESTPTLPSRTSSR